MAKKTIPDGSIVKGFRSLVNRFSPEAEKYARYKIQKKRGTYDDKQPSFPEPVYRGSTAEETANMNKGFNKPEKSTTAKKSTPREKVATASSVTEAKIKELDAAPIKGENIKAKKERSLSESDKQKLAKLEKMKDRADKKQSRKDESIERLAFRMGDKATFQDAAALKQKRSEARKQYLRNFASQLARGEQAAPIRGFGETDDAPTNDSTLSGASAEVTARKAQQEADTKNLFSSFSSIGNDNSDLLSNDIQSLGSFESEDSSPITYMKQEYRKKRGY